MSDRTVHAVSHDGRRVVVRYDRAGKWYVEYPGQMIPARHVTLHTAAYEARVMRANGGQVLLGLPGGSRFDTLAQKEEVL